MYWKTVSKRRCFFKNWGFTTVEMLVTVGIMAAVAAISIPLISSLGPSYNAKQAASNIVSQMQLVRVHAVKNRVTTVVAFYPKDYLPADQANSFLIFEDDNRNGTTDATDNNWIQDPGENVIVSRTYMPAKVSLQSATFTSNGSGGSTDTTSCGFDSQGIAARNGAVYVTGDIVLKNDNNQMRTISLNASGKTKVTTP